MTTVVVEMILNKESFGSTILIFHPNTENSRLNSLSLFMRVNDKCNFKSRILNRRRNLLWTITFHLEYISNWVREREKQLYKLIINCPLNLGRGNYFDKDCKSDREETKKSRTTSEEECEEKSCSNRRRGRIWIKRMKIQMCNIKLIIKWNGAK